MFLVLPYSVINRLLRSMNVIPRIKKIVVFFFSLYFKAFGNNLNMLIYIIIPAVMANSEAIMVLVIIGFRMRYASIAPRGSAMADIKVYKNAFLRLFVAL